MFKANDRVNTPGGKATVVYYIPPKCVVDGITFNSGMVAVKLDNRYYSPYAANDLYLPKEVCIIEE